MTDYMLEAITLAKQAAAMGEIPVGAVVVHKGEIIARTHNLVEAQNDPTAHAEMLALKEAGRALSTRHLVDCDLYVTLEPCPMCAQAINLARIRKLVYGAYDAKAGGVEHGPRMFQQPSAHHAPEVIGGVMESDCGALLRQFFSERR